MDRPLQQSHLALTNENLRDLFYLAPTAMVLSDLDEARPVVVNRQALALFGIAMQRADEIRTENLWEDPDDRARFIRQTLAQGCLRGYRTRLRDIAGVRFWADISATVIDHEGRRALLCSINDVSDTVAAEEILDRTRNMLTTLLEASPFPLVVTRLDTGEVRYCNQKAADLFETPLPGLLGHAAPEFHASPADRRQFVEKLRRTGKVEGFVAKLKTQNGRHFWAMLNAKTLEMNGEQVFMVSFADVTRQKNKEAELEDLAFRDSLTNAYNRRYFMEAVRIELARSKRGKQPLSLALLDIDHFKQLNDTFGHEAGDAVLRNFIELVQGMLRKTDVLARYGGEEFAILFPETDAAAAHDIIDRIRKTVDAHCFSACAGEAAVTFSAGIAATTPKAGSLVVNADRALYGAKRAGRNRTFVAAGESADEIGR